MDKRLFGSKHVDVYLNTYEIGVGVNYARQLKTLFIRFFVIEIAITFTED